MRDQAGADRARSRRLPVRLDHRQACQVECDRLCQDGVTAGIGAGQMNRRDSARIAAIRAREAAEANGWREPRTVGLAVASDAFFPFADGLLSAAEVGATAVIQPGGSIRDEEVIAAADEANLAMLFTGMRHFRH